VAHKVALYCVDWDNTTQRAQRFDVVDASTNVILDSRVLSSFSGGQYLVWNIKGHVKINVTQTGGANAVVSGLYFGANVAAASFVQIDATTKGNWKSVYGADGFITINDATSYPAYAQVAASGQGTHTWASSTSDPRGLQKATINDRIAASWYTSSTFTIDVNLTDGAIHRVAFYCVDWDTTLRVQRLDVVDASNNLLLDSRTLSSFNGGQYLVWNLKGHVKINVTSTAGGNAVLSGIYFR
jgi:hypothetical protein